jgi:hypothetical protein
MTPACFLWLACPTTGSSWKSLSSSDPCGDKSIGLTHGPSWPFKFWACWFFFFWRWYIMKPGGPLLVSGIVISVVFFRIHPNIKHCRRKSRCLTSTSLLWVAKVNESRSWDATFLRAASNRWLKGRTLPRADTLTRNFTSRGSTYHTGCHNRGSCVYLFQLYLNQTRNCTCTNIDWIQCNCEWNQYTASIVMRVTEADKCITSIFDGLQVREGTYHTYSKWTRSTWRCMCTIVGWEGSIID